jgi:osmotically-inducible protein OsmY
MVDDKMLKQNVLAALNWEPSVTTAHIGVETHDGVVTLTGHVESFMEKWGAEKAVSRVKGVRGLAEELEVRLPFDVKRGDEEIATAALHRLSWDGSLPIGAVKVKVEKGAVILTGEVEWHYQKDAAGWDVNGLLGVIRVSNQITIKRRANATNISDDIRKALHRTWFLDPTTVTVTADGGTVRLAGSVSNWHDRQVAEATAWAAPGASKVVNDIAVV